MTYDPNAGPPPSEPSPPAQPPVPPAGPPTAPPQPPAGGGYMAPQQYGYGYPVPVAVGTNGFAIASLVCAFLCWPLGLIFGFIAKSQIKTSGQGGDGLATAGIVISIVLFLITVIYIVLVFTVLRSVTNGFSNFNNLNNFLPSPTP